MVGLIREYRESGSNETLGRLLLYVENLSKSIIRKKKWYRYEEDMVQDVMVHFIEKDAFNFIRIDTEAERKTVQQVIYRITFNRMVSYLRLMRPHQHLNISDISSGPNRFYSRTDDNIRLIEHSFLDYHKLDREEMAIVKFCFDWLDDHHSYIGMKTALAEYLGVSKTKARQILYGIFSKMIPDPNESRLKRRNPFSR